MVRVVVSGNGTNGVGWTYADGYSATEPGTLAGALLQWSPMEHAYRFQASLSAVSSEQAPVSVSVNTCAPAGRTQVARTLVQATWALIEESAIYQ